MQNRPTRGLDNSSFRGHIRNEPRSAVRYRRQYADETNFYIDTPKLSNYQQPPKPVYTLPETQPASAIESEEADESKKTRRHHTKSDFHAPKQTRSQVLKRQMVKTSTKKYRPPSRRRILMPTILSGLAITLFIVGMLVVVNTLKTNHSVKAQVKQLAKQSSDNDGITDGIPAETDPPTNISSYSVAPDMPKIFTIEKLGVNARVRRMGVGPDNVLKAPASIFDVGWYDASAKPGENGTVVLDGHVSGPTRHGVFYGISSLKPGDKVQLQRGDGKTFTYSVTGNQLYDYDKVDMAKVMTSSVPGKPGLNFMTCTGRFNVTTNKFEQRVVVFTVQDP